MRSTIKHRCNNPTHPLVGVGARRSCACRQKKTEAGVKVIRRGGHMWPCTGESPEEKKRRKKTEDHCAPCELTPGFLACCISPLHAIIVINPLTFPGRPLTPIKSPAWLPGFGAHKWEVKAERGSNERAIDRNVSVPHFAMDVVLLAPCCHSLLRSVHISFCICTLYNLHILVELIAVSAGAEGPSYDYSAYTEVILLSSSSISIKPL